MITPITTNEKIKICDDTGRGDDFDVKTILFENDNVILCTVINDWYNDDFEVLIYKSNNAVISREFSFYIAKNY